MDSKENYGKVPLIWYAPGFNSETLDFYLGEAVANQRLCEEVDRIADLMPRPYAFVKKLSSSSKIKMLRLDWQQLNLEADLLERASKNLLAKFKI